MSAQIDLLALAVQANITTLLVGAPGVGKTAITESIAAQISKIKGEDFPLVVTNAAQALPEDLGGAQVPDHETRTMRSYAMGAIQPLVKARQGLHLIDEAGSASPAMRAALLSVTEGRRYGDEHLPGVSVVAAMNPPDIATAGADMTLPESNRFFWLQWELTVRDWADLMQGGPGALAKVPVLPKDWTKHISRVNSWVASFVTRNPALLLKPNPEEPTRPWPSPRSWTRAARMLAAVFAAGFDKLSDQAYMAIEGNVGKGAADTFVHWLRELDLPDPEEILSEKDPKKAAKMIPARKDQAIVSLEAVAVAARSEHQDQAARWSHAWDILEAVAEDHEDFVESPAKILVVVKPTGSPFPKLANRILKVRRDLGMAQ